jgi:hypothetical protein
MLAERDYRIFDSRKEWPKILNYQSFDAISEGGEFKKNNAAIMDEWKKNTPTKTTGKGKTTPAPKVSKPTTTTPAGKVTAKKEEEEESTTVEVEVLDKDGKALDMRPDEAKQVEDAWKDAKSIGLMVSYESDRELAQHIGVNEIEMANMGQLKLANELSKVCFALYYALGRADTAGDLREVKRGARGTHARIERAEEKKKLAEGKIWEFKTLVQILATLHGRRYKLCAHNVRLVLDAYPGLSKSRRADVFKTAEQVLGSPDTLKVIESLGPFFDDKATRKALRRRERGSETKLLTAGTEE